MALAAVVWSHMEAQGVQPTPEEYIGMIKGWAAAGELGKRVLDGSVEAYLRWLSSSGFELSSGPSVASAGVSSAVGGEGVRVGLYAWPCFVRVNLLARAVAQRCRQRTKPLCFFLEHYNISLRRAALRIKCWSRRGEGGDAR